MFFIDMNEDGYHKCTEEEANYVFLNMKEYHGYLNALRIMHDKALVNKSSKDDKHGYRLLAAELKKESKSMQAPEYWYVRMSTPYASSEDYKKIYLLIKHDLIRYYDYVDFDLYDDLYYFHNDGFSKGREHIVDGLFDHYVAQDNRFEPKNRIACPENDRVDKVLNNGDFAFKIVSIKTNFSTGKYEVTYMRTKKFNPESALIVED